MYVKDCLNYAVIERISEEALQALWIKIQFCGSRNTICGVIYSSRIHHSTFKTALMKH